MVAEHVYLSTACLHGEHGYCQAPTVTRDGEWEAVGPSYTSHRNAPKTPAQCKFCPARCVCDCHGEASESGRERSHAEQAAGGRVCGCRTCRSKRGEYLP